MTSILEKTISVIAPHRCISCSKENNVLCDGCAATVFGDGPEVCFLCNKPVGSSIVCTACRQQTALDHVWMAAVYEGAVKQLIRAFKFERVRAAYRPLAEAMADVVPYLDDVVVVHVPTAPDRVRQRGYDQSQLMAREIAKRRGWQYAPLLRRRSSVRQVGSTRAVRMRQAHGAFELSRSAQVGGRHVLLVDDVTTSGATLLAAAKLVAQAGAVRVDAVVAAKHTLE